MSEADAAVTSRRRVSAVWIVPGVAMLLGLWLVVDAYLSRGPTIEIAFATAEGIEVDATSVRVRSVQVGTVTDIALSDDQEGVVVTAELSADADDLLRDDTHFWVVRPRIGPSGVSGLGTIVSGAYVEMSPGGGQPSSQRRFDGLENVPPTPAGTPGLRVVLVSDTSGYVGVGDPVLYRGYPVGRVEQSRLDVESRDVRYSVFIDAPYDSLVTTSTRFWDASGISAEITPEGATVDVASLETLIAGGVAFDQPQSARPGGPVSANEIFQLYADAASIQENPHRFGQSYVVRFNQSVRGLTVDAPVTLRGIAIGNVERIMVHEGTAAALDNGTEAPIPVLIRIHPGRLEIEDSEAGIERLRTAMEQAVRHGLRGSLESGSLLTGSLYVNFDFYGEPAPGRVGEFAGYPTLPTVQGGLERMQQQVVVLLDKLNDLPLDQTVTSVNSTLQEVKGTVEDLRGLLNGERLETLSGELSATLKGLNTTLNAYSNDGGLPQQLDATLSELRHTLRAIQSAADTLERDPNTLIFPSNRAQDPEIRKGAP